MHRAAVQTMRISARGFPVVRNRVAKLTSRRTRKVPSIPTQAGYRQPSMIRDFFRPIFVRELFKAAELTFRVSSS